MRDYNNHDEFDHELGCKFSEVPQSQEAEQALLGAFMFDSMGAWVACRDFVKPNDFYNPVHVMIAEAVWRRCGLNLKVDAILLKNRFAQQETLHDIGGVEYLAMMLDNAPPVATASEYSKLIADMANRRRLMAFSLKVIKDAKDLESDKDALNQWEFAKNSLDGFRGDFPASSVISFNDEAALEVIDNIGVRRPMGRSTGIPNLDKIIAGLHDGRNYTLAGRPGMGKTLLANNIMRNMARYGADETNEDPGVVLNFSQEMGTDEGAMRDLSAEVGAEDPIHYINIEKHDVTPLEIERLRGAQKTMPRILVDATPKLTLTEIKQRAFSVLAKHGKIHLICVDYLQLCSFSDRDGDSRAARISDFCNSWKSFLKEINAAGLLLSQLSRAVENTDSKVPKLSHLKESGGIEEAANVVMFMFNEAYYMRQEGCPRDDGDAVEWHTRLTAAANSAAIHIGKNRGGPLQPVDIDVEWGSDLVIIHPEPEEVAYSSYM